MISPSTIVTVPCFSGSPWYLEQLTPLSDWSLRTMRLPEALDNIEAYADFVAGQVVDLDRYILVGDSFGANIAIALATRHPRGLVALVLSGGFAANPITNPITKLKLTAASFLPGNLYQQITLRFHAQSLASPFDVDGQVPLSQSAIRELFIQNTPRRSYLSRMKAAFSANYLGKLDHIQVPTLILTPAYERLIGKNAAQQLVEGIPNATEVILPNTGHMFRFTHPVTYANAIREFLQDHLVGELITR
ncbi:putative hydrolase or acyltransferase of alpha/beta superfamily [Synechococcus sp. PCC 7502]|uniref:alpha/beta fold hydrolase n=1 Tax=Synechococcus sp. PCC 7502 TaxID=1173263 RepID=UPI00029FEF14|nr:alpha/beta hydrolase [Synechococcus sp. PCC 7502]AFY75414.1 putative hydrolase or acyltransferase of alpha/beta superfamily [Synechococcus sp. PCC 7502]